jgi:hypothetical protein
VFLHQMDYELARGLYPSDSVHEHSLAASPARSDRVAHSLRSFARGPRPLAGDGGKAGMEPPPWLQRRAGRLAGQARDADP